MSAASGLFHEFDARAVIAVLALAGCFTLGILNISTGAGNGEVPTWASTLSTAVAVSYFSSKSGEEQIRANRMPAGGSRRSDVGTLGARAGGSK